MALAMGLATVACAPKAEEEKPLTDENGFELLYDVSKEGDKALEELEPVTKQETNDASYLIGVNFGSILASSNLKDMNLSLILKGMKDFLNAKGTPNDPDFADQFKVDPNTMGKTINDYIRKKSAYQASENLKKGQAFLEKNAKRTGIQVSASGLQYEIIQAGSGDAMSPLDTAYVRYKGTFTDGEVFDQVSPDQEPIPFTLGSAIPGFEEALRLVGEGGVVKAYLPSDLAYGVRGQGKIEPNTVLIFEIAIDKIGRFVPAEQ